MFSNFAKITRIKGGRNGAQAERFSDSKVLSKRNRTEGDRTLRKCSHTPKMGRGACFGLDVTVRERQLEIFSLVS